MYIKSIYLSNLKSIDKLHFEFKSVEPGWHVILGDNGAGKSTLIKSIALALIGPYEARSLRQDWSRWINSNSNHAEIKW